MAVAARGVADRSTGGRWVRLAAVARERASEQSAKAATAPNARVAGPHLEQQAYLVKLAEVYEQRAKAIDCRPERG